MKAPPESPLAVCVRRALRGYFKHLRGERPTRMYDMVMREMEKPLLETVLHEAGYNQTAAAKMLGLSRGTLSAKLRRHKIKKRPAAR